MKKPSKAKKKPTAEDLLREAQRDKRKLAKENNALRKALAQACDLALDASDIIVAENISEAEEDEEFQMMIIELRDLSKLPEAERHVHRREEKAREKAARQQERLEKKVALLQVRQDAQVSGSAEPDPTASS